MEKKLQVFGSSICGFEGMYQKNKNCACKNGKSIVYYTSQCSGYSAIAQSVEQTAVNRWVVGSSPTRGV